MQPAASVEQMKTDYKWDNFGYKKGVKNESITKIHCVNGPNGMPH